MRVCVVLEKRFCSTPDGAVWTDGQFPHSFWLRYLAAFEQVRVIARVRQVSGPLPGWKRADGDRVAFAPVPCYVGPTEYLRQARAVRHAVRAAVDDRDAVILRVPSNLGSILFPVLRRNRRPYAAEVVADPHDAFSPGGVRHPLRPLFRWWFTRQLRQNCRQACGAAYVTAEAIQRRYPPGATALAISCSDVELPPSAIADHPRVMGPTNGRARTLVMVGGFAQLYKAPDVLIDAVAQCVKDHLNLRLRFVGDGGYRAELESRAAAQGLAGRVDFLGQLPAGQAIRTVLDEADVFVLPSRTEGLPRALVEAMARGLPSIGSTVGGIPELLPPQDLVPPGDAAALAGKIREVVSDPQRMARMSARNLEKAKEYREDVLCARRSEFYHNLREETEAWLIARNGKRGTARSESDAGETAVIGYPPFGKRLRQPGTRQANPGRT